MRSTPLVDCAGRRRSPATMSGFHQGRPPRNKGLRYPPDPPTVEEIIAVMRAAGDRSDGLSLRSADRSCFGVQGCGSAKRSPCPESDLDRTRGAVLVRRGKGGKRREVGMDRWAWEQLEPWLTIRAGSAGWRALLRAPGPHLRPPLLPIRDSRPTAQRRPRGRSAPSVRAAPAPPRPRRRDESGRSPTTGHPTATRSRRPRDHLRLPARDRQHRDHPRRPRAARTNDPCNQRTRLPP